jgi:hypothetical protein
MNTQNQHHGHLVSICTSWTMFFGAGVVQNLPRPEGLVFLSPYAPHWNLTSWYTCPQTAE